MQTGGIFQTGGSLPNTSNVQNQQIGNIFQNSATNAQPQSNALFGQKIAQNPAQNPPLFGGAGAQTMPSMSSGNQPAQQNANTGGFFSNFPAKTQQTTNIFPSSGNDNKPITGAPFGNIQQNKPGSEETKSNIAVPEQKPQVIAPMYSNPNTSASNTSPLFSITNPAQTFSNLQNPASNAQVNPSAGLFSNLPPQKSNEAKPQIAQNLSNPAINVNQALFQNAPQGTNVLFPTQGNPPENKPVTNLQNIAAPLQKPQIDIKAPVENQQNNMPPPVTPSFSQNPQNIVFDQTKTNKAPFVAEEQKGQLNMSPTEQRDKNVNQQENASIRSRESEQSAPQGERPREKYPLIDGLKTKNKDLPPQSFEQRGKTGFF